MSTVCDDFERGYTRQDIINLYRFIDWIMQLPKDLNREYKQEVLLYEQAKRMHYITSIEQLALEEGYDKGVEEGLQVAQRQLVKLLRHRFGEVEAPLVESLQRFSLAQLDSLTDVALTITSLEAFAAHMAQLPATLTKAE